MAEEKDKLKLQAAKRTVTGRKVKQLRRSGILPGTVYGKNTKSISVQVPHQEFSAIFAKAGETGLVQLKIEGEEKTRPVLISNLQKNPLTGDAIHFDLHEVDLKEKITATVPVELVGESPAVKEKLGILIQQLSEVEVEALPADLPDKLELNISPLKVVDDSLTVSNLKAPADVTILTDSTQILAKIEPQAKEEVVEAPAPAEGEAVVETPAEGEAPAETPVAGETVEVKPAEPENKK
jgi:large subunit ribosomal protein L25